MPVFLIRLANYDTTEVGSTEIRVFKSFTQNGYSEVFVMDATECLTQFLSQMLAWETDYHQRRRSPAYKANADERLKADSEARAKLLEIFDYCLSRKAKGTLARSRSDLLNTGRPAEFAQVVIPGSLSATEGKVQIQTINHKALAPYRRYTLIVEDEKFKVDAVHGRASEDIDWVSRKAI